MACAIRYTGYQFGNEKIKIWDAETGSELPSFLGHRGYVQEVAFSADGKYLLSLNRNAGLFDGNAVSAGTLRIWDAGRGARCDPNWPNWRRTVQEWICFQPGRQLAAWLRECVELAHRS